MRREKSNRVNHQEIYHQTTPPLIALEGVGGSGKSHMGGLVTQKLENRGHQVLNAKVSGLGDSDRVQRLRKINDHRERLIKQGKASPKILEDKKKDKIFRLATRHQIKLLLQDLEKTEADIGILDRTPIMPWVYSASSNPENPYLGEMLFDGLEQTEKLNISTIYFLDVSPSTAYSRLIARAIKGSNNPNQLAHELCSRINADHESSQEIIKQAINLITNPEIKSKNYRRWDFIPYETMVNECQNYREVLQRLEKDHSTKTVFINAEQPIDQVVGDLLADIQKNQML